MWVSDREKHDAGCSTDVHHLLGLGIGKERVNSDTRHRGAGLVAGDKKPFFNPPVALFVAAAVPLRLQ